MKKSKRRSLRERGATWNDVLASANRLDAMGVIAVNAVIGEVDADGHAREPALRVAAGPLIEQIAERTGCAPIEVMQRLAYGLLEVRAGRMTEAAFIAHMTAPRGSDEQWIALSV